MPVLLALLTGVIDYAWVVLHQHLAADAAATGVRAGAVAAEGDDAASVARSATSARWAGFGLQTEVQVVASEAADRIEVEVTVPDVRLVGLVPSPSALVIVRSRVVEDAL